MKLWKFIQSFSYLRKGLTPLQAISIFPYAWIRGQNTRISVQIQQNEVCIDTHISRAGIADVPQISNCITYLPSHRALTSTFLKTLVFTHNPIFKTKQTINDIMDNLLPTLPSYSTCFTTQIEGNIGSRLFWNSPCLNRITPTKQQPIAFFHWQIHWLAKV